MTATCAFCEEAITIKPANEDEWSWVDPEGSSIGTNYPDGFFSPTFWQDLAERDIETYSMLNAMDQLCMTGWMHSHYPKSESRTAYQGVVEDCCGLPMRLAPRGWVCRTECGSVVALGVEHGALQVA